MGVDYHATAIIGCRVPHSKALEVERIRQCKHPESPSAYCPHCGAPMWKTRKYLREDLENPPANIKVEQESGEDERDYFVGVVGVSTESNRSGSELVEFTKLDKSIEQYKNEVKAFLEPLGLWDEKEFGLWSILNYG